MKFKAVAFMAMPILLPCAALAKAKAHASSSTITDTQAIWTGVLGGLIALAIVISALVVIVKGVISLITAPARKRTQQQEEESVATALAQKTMDRPLQAVTPNGLVLQRGEQCYFQCTATSIAVQTASHRVGGYGGVSVPIGHGIRLNTGALRSRSVKNQSLVSEGQGTLFLTNHRVVWISSRTNHVNTLDSILQNETVLDGLKLTFSNRSPLAYVTGDVTAGVMLQKILTQRAAA
jgi:hypothetical protein